MTKSKILTVISYGENPGESERVTFQAMSINSLVSPEKLVEMQGMSLHKVFVKVVDEPAMVIHVNGLDLEQLEEAVGLYDFEDV